MSQQDQLIIIDGHSLAFRAFHALASSGLRSSRGEPTYAVFGFVQALLTLLQERQPAYMAIAFDVGRTFRHDTYPDYKAGRAETPEEFHPQLERIKQLMGEMGVPIYTAEGYEADDVIGTLARQASNEGIASLILTGDTDTLQLVDEQVSVLLSNPYGKNVSTTLYNEQKVRERYHGLAPDRLTDLRGLKGDASDNIPGVKGIGEKGAINLLNQFGTIEALYENLGAVDKRYRKYLKGQQEQALLSKHLATIVCTVPGVALDLAAASLRGYNRAAVMHLFQEMEFRSLIEKLPQETDFTSSVESRTPALADVPLVAPPQPGETQTPDPGGSQLSMFDLSPVPPAGSHTPSLGNYRAVTNEETLRELTNELATAPGFAFDTEATGLRPFESELVGISLATRPGAAWYVPIAHSDGEHLERERGIEALRPFFADPQKAKYAHHAKFDIEMLLQAGVQVEGLTFDTMIAAGLLDKRKKLKDLAFYELQLPEPMTEITDLIGRGKKQVSFGQIPVEQATPYAAADADMTLRLVALLEQQMSANEQITQIFRRIEMPLVPILVDMEQAGIGLDVAYLRNLSGRLATEIGQVEQQIYALAGGDPFNINSSIQLNEVLFARLGLPTDGLSKTSTGRYSLAAGALEKLSDSHEIVRAILHHRHLTKLKSTYVDALPELVNKRTGRLHTSFHQMGTATGRLASSTPNLQNIPVRSESGGEIRRAFVAAPGCQFVAADYSQIELRVLAHITRDPNLVQAFQEGQDIHAAMAAQLFHVPIDAVQKDQRRIAKTTVFGIIYGISSFGLARRTDLSRSEAQELIDAFFARFPGVRRYMDNTLKQGRTKGYVESLFGRRRPVPDLTTNGPRRQAAEREAINTPIQSTAADLMKLAMIGVATRLKQEQRQTRMLLQVHDELIFEVPLDESEAVQRLVRETMEQVYRLDVPLKVDVEIGDNWQQMEKVEP
jgi:DNA polymerase I